MPFPEPLLAAMPQLSEKLRLGVQSRNPAWYPGFNVCNSTTAIGLQFRCSETVSGPVVAPNNATPWYKNPCVQSALAKGAGSATLDAIGLLPEGGEVSAAFSLWHGAAGVSNGTKMLQNVKMGAGLISTASSGSDSNWFGGVTGALSIGASLAKAAPVYGQVLSGISLAGDVYSTYKAVAGCHP